MGLLVFSKNASPESDREFFCRQFNVSDPSLFFASVKLRDPRVESFDHREDDDAVDFLCRASQMGRAVFPVFSGDDSRWFLSLSGLGAGTTLPDDLMDHLLSWAVAQQFGFGFAVESGLSISVPK